MDDLGLDPEDDAAIVEDQLARLQACSEDSLRQSAAVELSKVLQEQALEEIYRLKAALRVYADEENWKGSDFRGSGDGWQHADRVLSEKPLFEITRKSGD